MMNQIIIMSLAMRQTKCGVWFGGPDFFVNMLLVMSAGFGKGENSGS